MTWQVRNTLTETDWLVVLEANSVDPSSAVSERSSCGLGMVGVWSLLSSGKASGKMMGELGRSKSIVSMTRFLLARPWLLPTRTRKTTSNDREEGTCSGGLLRFPIRGRDGSGMMRMRHKRRSVDDQAPQPDTTPPNANKYIECLGSTHTVLYLGFSTSLSPLL